MEYHEIDEKRGLRGWMSLKFQFFDVLTEATTCGIIIASVSVVTIVVPAL